MFLKLPLIKGGWGLWHIQSTKIWLQFIYNPQPPFIRGSQKNEIPRSKLRGILLIKVRSSHQPVAAEGFKYSGRFFRPPELTKELSELKCKSSVRGGNVFNNSKDSRYRDFRRAHETVLRVTCIEARRFAQCEGITGPAAPAAVGKIIELRK